MKKCKITLSKSNAKKKYFYLAPTAEMLYLLKSNSNEKMLIKNLRSNLNIEIVSLDVNQWIEVEWNGCHNIQDDYCMTRMNYVKLVKTAKLTLKDDDAKLVSIHAGWILNEHLKFNDQRKNGLKIKMLYEDDEQYDFSELFQDEEVKQKSIKYSHINDMC